MTSIHDIHRVVYITYLSPEIRIVKPELGYSLVTSKQINLTDLGRVLLRQRLIIACCCCEWSASLTIDQHLVMVFLRQIFTVGLLPLSYAVTLRYSPLFLDVSLHHTNSSRFGRFIICSWSTRTRFCGFFQRIKVRTEAVASFVNFRAVLKLSFAFHPVCGRRPTYQSSVGQCQKKPA